MATSDAWGEIVFSNSSPQKCKSQNSENPRPRKGKLWWEERRSIWAPLRCPTWFKIRGAQSDWGDWSRGRGWYYLTAGDRKDAERKGDTAFLVPAVAGGGGRQAGKGHLQGGGRGGTLP